MKKKLYMVVALLVALVLTGGTFAYTATVDAIAGVGDLTQDSDLFAEVTDQVSVTWTDNVTAGTSGTVGTGDLWAVDRDSTFTGDVQLTVYLTNSGDLVQTYEHLNMEIGTTSGTPSDMLLTLVNGKVSFILSASTANITLDGGGWTTHQSIGTTVEPDLWCEVSQVGL